jgi:flavin reductase (DIM6/NTAB) family NADH-FMN oxidoreductase RutF
MLVIPHQTHDTVVKVVDEAFLRLSSEEQLKQLEGVDALVSFDCQIEQIQEVGTHTIFICRTVAIQKSQHEHSLVYFNRAYHQVGETEVA